jgi:hypothetical protein
VWLRPHLVLWSEPAFLALVLLDVALLHALAARATAGRLALLAAVAAAALLLRYAGGFLLLLNAFALTLWTMRGSRPSRRLWIATAVTAASASPLAAWLLWRHLSGSAAARSLAWHPPDFGAFSGVGATIAGWYPLPATAWPLGLALLALAFAAVRFAEAGSPARWLAAAIGAYLVFLAGSLFLFDANMPLDDRLLLPVFVLVVLLLFAAACQARRTAARLLFALPLLALVAGLGGGVRLWSASRHEGIGLASRQMRELPVLAHLASLPPQWRIVTNGPELFTINFARDASMLPRGVEPRTRRANPRFVEQMDRVGTQADVIVWFQPMQFRSYLPPPDVIDQLEGFRRVYSAPDAVVWTRAPAAAP